MELHQTFTYSGWAMRYILLNTSSQTTSDAAKTPTIVFVHGTPWSSQVFFPVAQALSSQPAPPQILLYDLPGYGQSQTYTSQANSTEASSTLFQGDTSVKFQAQALAALLHHLDLQSPNIIAHDIAGTIALRAHFLHSVDFTSMLLMDTNTVLPWGDGFYKLVRSNPEVFVNLPAHIFEGVLRATIRSASYDPDENLMNSASRWEDVLAQPWLGSLEKQRSFVRQIAQADDGDVKEMLDKDLYKEVRCPVKILWGEEDSWIPREKMERLKGMLGERLKKFVVVPKAGHLVMLDQPESVEREVLEWVAKMA